MHSNIVRIETSFSVDSHRFYFLFAYVKGKVEKVFKRWYLLICGLFEENIVTTRIGLENVLTLPKFPPRATKVYREK